MSIESELIAYAKDLAEQDEINSWYEKTEEELRDEFIAEVLALAENYPVDASGLNYEVLDFSHSAEVVEKETKKGMGI